MALADTLDDLISSRRIEPQLAIKIMTNFDQVMSQVLGDRVKARMSFKVGAYASVTPYSEFNTESCFLRVIWIPTASVTKSGHSSSKTSSSSWTTRSRSKPRRSRLSAACQRTKHSDEDLGSSMIPY